ncbi:MAG: hypothetical protein RL286_962, partial [Bacteroidota bacterium]
MKIFFSFFICFLSLHLWAQVPTIDVLSYQLNIKLADHTDSIYVTEQIELLKYESE